MDGSPQNSRHLHLSGCCCHHRTGTPPWRPCSGLPAVAVSLPVLLYLEMLPGQRPDEGGGTQFVLGSPDDYLGDSVPPQVSDYAGGFELYVPVL